MTVEQLEREQAKALPKDDLSPFAGRWVALRDGRVVADDLDAASLRSQPEVHEDDVLLPVPPTGKGVYIL